LSETLSSITGKANDFATRFMGGGSTSITGGVPAIITITPPTDQRVRMTHLSVAAGSERRNISLFIGNEEVLSRIMLIGGLSGGAGTWGDIASIGSYQPYAVGDPPNGNYDYFTGDTNEVVTIFADDSTQTATIYYGYEFGE